MRITFANVIGFLFAVSIILGLTMTVPTNNWAIVLVALLVNIISAPIGSYVVQALNSVKMVPLLFATKVLYRNQFVRLSFSYLIKIKVSGKYLLVKNRKENYYQLVGGAYKRYQSSEQFFNKFQVKSDRIFETEEGIAKNDLRLQVPGKFVLDIINWFSSRQDREISQWREFCEELLTPEILDKHLFRYIDYKYVETLTTPIRKSKYLNNQEVRVFEVYEFIPSPEQETALKHLMSQNNTESFKWADETLIDSLGFNELKREMEFEIGPHTKWAIHLKHS